VNCGEEGKGSEKPHTYSIGIKKRTGKGKFLAVTFKRAKKITVIVGKSRKKRGREGNLNKQDLGRLLKEGGLAKYNSGKTKVNQEG